MANHRIGCTGSQINRLGLLCSVAALGLLALPPEPFGVSAVAQTPTGQETPTTPTTTTPTTTPPAQTPSGQPLPQVTVAQPKARPKQAAPRPKGQPTARPLPAPTPVATPVTTPTVVTTPLNTNTVAGVTSVLGLTPFQSPATVEIVDRQMMQDRGYQTNVEAVKGAVGVLAIDAAGAPGNFAMRGFQFGEVNVLYNGISTGPASITGRVMDTANLSQIEFLKGPNSLMTGMNAIGGTVNYVSLQPHTGPIRNELDLSVDSLGTVRSHFGSGGSTDVKGLDYRFDAIATRLNGYIDDVYKNLTNASGQLNYRTSNEFMAWTAFDYGKMTGHAYWGTPVIPIAFAGPFAKGGVVSGTAVSTFDGSPLGPVTFDTRTLKTNYNVSDNSIGNRELWLRSGWEYTPSKNLTVKSQVYAFDAKRHWLDAETYSFNIAPVDPGKPIDRDRFFVGHNQRLYGGITDVIFDSRPLGMENRFATRLQANFNKLTFSQFAGGYPEDSVELNPIDRGVFGVLEPDNFYKQLNTVSASFEDRLKVTPWLSLIGGVRFENISLDQHVVNFDGTPGTGSRAPLSKTWDPVSYRAAVTIEPLPNLMFYGMTATAFDPAFAGIFSLRGNRPLELTSSRIYEGGVKQLFWDNRAEWTLSVYDIVRQNVYVQITNAVATLAGEVETKGVEIAAAVRPFAGLKLWGNVAFTQAKFKDFDVFTGNTPSNVAPIIANAGASYRWDSWRWPVEVGGSVRHVGNRFLSEDNLTTMESYTTADVYAFVDIPGRDLGLRDVNNVRGAFRIRNLTNRIYAAFSDSGYPDQFYLGAPRTYEVATSFKW